MSNIYNVELQNRLRAYVSEVGNQEIAGSNIGIGKTVVSLYLNSNYGRGSRFGKGDLAGTEHKIAEFFRIHDARKEQPAVSSPQAVDPMRYAPISVSESIYKDISYCQLVKGMLMVTGDSGIGKTMAARKFRLDNPTTAIYIEATPVLGVLSRFLRVLATELRITERMEQGALVEEIKARLRGTNTVLIIDEAQNLKFTTREEIRNWSQPHPITGQAGVGIVLMGNPEMEEKMKRGRYARLYDQQRNRSRSQHYGLKNTTLDDIRMIFPGLQDKAREKEARLMLAISHTWAGIRNATILWNDAIQDGGADYDTLRQKALNEGILVA
ncbi:ATP-binding protein [Ruminococcaceae bacterium OttesenSCG-928-A11]|nr:ATP-binding protein [Ruminococcaceae bacterium OttesenSCG-928-A11]